MCKLRGEDLVNGTRRKKETERVEEGGSGSDSDSHHSMDETR